MKSKKRKRKKKKKKKTYEQSPRHPGRRAQATAPWSQTPSTASSAWPAPCRASSGTRIPLLAPCTATLPDFLSQKSAIKSIMTKLNRDQTKTQEQKKERERKNLQCRKSQTPSTLLSDSSAVPTKECRESPRRWLPSTPWLRGNEPRTFLRQFWCCRSHWSTFSFLSFFGEVR